MPANPRPTQPPTVEVDELRELFAPPRGWMLHWGNAALLALLLLLLGLAAWIRYPDEVRAPVQLTVEPPPLRVVAPEAGRIDRILVGEGADVAARAPLILLENPAEWPEIEKLAEVLDRLEALPAAEAMSAEEWPMSLEVGELRPAYARLLNTAEELRYRLRRTAAGRQREALVQQLRQLDSLDRRLALQLRDMRAEVAIADSNAANFARLLAEGAASQIERDEAQIRLLRVLREREQLAGQRERTEVDRARLRRELTALREDQSEEIASLWLNLRAEGRSLRQALAVWEDRHLQRAPEAGWVSFPTPLRQGQFVAAHEPLLTLVTGARDTSLLAEGYLPAEALGKINVGSKALLQVSAYPHREYGQVPARVRDISATAAGPAGPDVRYRLRLSLPEGLVSTFGDTLLFRQDLPATAIIIAEERSLLGRLFDRLRQLRD